MGGVGVGVGGGGRLRKAEGVCKKSCDLWRDGKIDVGSSGAVFSGAL